MVYNFPLYLYPEITKQTSTEATAARTPNLNLEIVNKIAEKLGLQFFEERHCEERSNLLNPDEKSFSPTDILDYIYAVLHSPTYREKYKEFLKIDFPRVPYPKDLQTFENLVSLGAQLRQLHLLESDVTEKYITQYPIAGNNVVSKIKFEPNVIASEHTNETVRKRLHQRNTILPTSN